LLLGTAWFCSQIAVFALDPQRTGRRPSRDENRHCHQPVDGQLPWRPDATGRIEVWHVLTLGALLGVINAFDMPGRQALVIHMTSQDDLLNAISLNSAVFNTARIVGPGIAGLVVAAVGEGVCFFINGLSFLAVIAGLVAMRMPSSEPQGVAVGSTSSWIPAEWGTRCASPSDSWRLRRWTAG
jgi:MFS family permease